MLIRLGRFDPNSRSIGTPLEPNDAESAEEQRTQRERYRRLSHFTQRARTILSLELTLGMPLVAS